MPTGGKGPGPSAPATELPETRLSKIFGRYASTFDTWLTRYQRALADSRNGSYSTDKWMSDVGTFWGEAVSLMAFPLTVVDPAAFGGELRPLTPTITFDGTVDTIVEAIPIADPGSGVTAVDVARLVSPPGDSIPTTNVKAELSAGRRSVIVTLSGLSALVSGGKVPVGTYTGNITPKGATTPILARLNVERK